MMVEARTGQGTEAFKREDERMSGSHRWRFWRKGPTDDEIARELRDHLDLEAEELAEAGDEAEARDRARRSFGNPTLAAERVRDGWRARWWDEFSQDVRHGARALRRSPAYAVAAVVTLALGIGATTTVFSIADSILNRAFPLIPQGELVWITKPSKSCPACDDASAAAYTALTEDAPSLRQVVAASHWRAAMRFANGTELAQGYLVSPSTFDAISAPFAIGTGFRGVAAADHATSRQVVLSYEYWVSRFAKSRGVVGSAGPGYGH